MKLYVRDEIDELQGLVLKLMETINRIMGENLETYMPGFTHLQKAQPGDAGSPPGRLLRDVFPAITAV